MARRGSLYALACAEDSRTEAFEVLRAPARMLGVRKGGLGVKVSLLGKELMLMVIQPGRTSRERHPFLECLVLAYVTLLAPGGQDKAW